jgi:hypothetical protein
VMRRASLYAGMTMETNGDASIGRQLYNNIRILKKCEE